MSQLSAVKRVSASAAILLSCALGTHSVTANEFVPADAQDPLFLSAPVRPIMMLNMSNDHQLYFKLYDDYSDLTGDGLADTTYVHSHDYFGYFNSETCYEYTDGVYEPSSAVDSEGYCSSKWNGNFLNWATMTRMDAVRKILYGGSRQVDTAERTVLERAFIPHDAHSFAKYYNGSDINKLVPFTVTSGVEASQASGITICNTTEGTGESQTVDSPPLLRIAKGNYSLWASNERWQCRWADDVSGTNGQNNNDSTSTGIYASSSSPDEDDVGLGDGDYNVRVSVCESGFFEDNCSKYPDGNFKPTGLLQQYGETGRIQFGLLTGSYAKNKSGGVLRKNVGDMTDEINVETDGTFKAAPASGNIIGTLDSLRIYGYDYDDGLYSGDDCPFGLTGFDDGTCSNWGNPQSEIYLESLRYLAGASANTAFSADDSAYISGLVSAEWVDPMGKDNYCAPLSVVQFNASTSSYDGQTPNVNDIGLTGSVEDWVNKIGAAEDIHGSEFFVGETASDDDQLCTPKTISNLSDASGTCPDAPRLEGTYNIAGMAYYARDNSIRSDLEENTQEVTTYGVALSPATPSVTVPVPGGAEGQVVNILPACQNQETDDAGNSEGNCAIVDFKIVSQTNTDATSKGKLYINWEAAEQGGDYDSDMWGILDYVLTSGTLTITTNVIDESSSRPLGFGYVLSGTSTDGFHAHSGMNGFDYTDETAPAGAVINGCIDCQSTDTATTNTYIVQKASTQRLEPPLFYAAKWGGYPDDDMTEDEIRDIEEPDTYSEARDPQALQESLGAAFGRVADSIGAASSVATNSTRLNKDDFLYQARFSSTDWSGEIRAFPVGADGFIDISDPFTTVEAFADISYTSRHIYTLNSETGNQVKFEWSLVSDAQRAVFDLAGSAISAENRFNWVRGDQGNEGIDELREREQILGDIVNSSPVHFGERDFGYSRLGGDLGAAYTTYLANKRDRAPSILVGANDGMLHSFYADDSTGKVLQERFAYIPLGVYDSLPNLTMPSYGRADNGHRYSVDGPVTVSDAYFDGAWRTVAVGTLGAGGKGIYALDITDPDYPEVIFDYTGENEQGLGYIMGEPVVARMANGKWMVVFGNGYATGSGHLFALDLESPALPGIKLSAGDASTGLSGVSLLPGRDGTIERAYAGDLQGNIWRFDLNDETTGNWKLGLAGKPLFTAKDADGKLQPITAAPELGFNSAKDNAVMVYFGTGKYLDSGDNGDISHTNSFYGIADTGVALTYTTARTEILHEKGLAWDTVESNRTVEDDFGMDWSEDEGWFLDFDLVDGERVIETPMLLFDRLLFATINPSDVPCEYGGTSWLMDLIAVGTPFDNDERLLEEFVQTNSMILGPPLVGVVNASSGLAFLNTSDGKAFDEKDSGEEGDGSGGGGGGGTPLDWPESAIGRQSWQQIR